MADRHEPSPEQFYDDTPQENTKRGGWAGAAVGLCVVAIIGTASALAWRAYADPWLAAQEAQAGTVKELKAAVQQLEASQQQLVQRINALQTSQQQGEQSRQIDQQRFSEQMAALSRNVEKTAKEAAAKQTAQKRSSVADNKPKDSNADNKPKDSKLTQTSSVGSPSASGSAASKSGLKGTAPTGEQGTAH